MSTEQLIKELLDKPENEIIYSLFILISKGKLNFTTLSNIYVKYLETLNKDRLNLLAEAETCVAESFTCRKTKYKEKKNGVDYKHTQRCLYLLNKSKKFNMDKLNEKYNYNEQEGKSLSSYERSKEITSI